MFKTRTLNSLATFGFTVGLMIVGLPLVASQSKATATPAPEATVEGTYNCPCSIWETPEPRTKNQQDAAGVEVGLKFQTTVDGYITGVRFYKGSANKGEHSGHLWSSDGELLAEVTFEDESASGWQEASFEKPIPVTAKTTYVISYFTKSGWYSVDRPTFSKNLVNGPLIALQSKGSGGNGVYIYTGKPRFPNQSFQSSNYWVDVIFVTDVAAEATPEVTATATPKSS
ncbi:MAG: DUF4082 domain-containing protein [Anaerolineaceae bacterium]|nr:DUF4082 domain-containing protein [Anaerolineaceae bacterium]